MWAVNRQFDIIWILFMSSPFHKIHIKWALGSETGWVKATGESLRCDAASFSGECDTDLPPKEYFDLLLEDVNSL